MDSELLSLQNGIPPVASLPPPSKRDPSLPHAPVRRASLTADEFRLAIRNALRYFPPEEHALLAEEFASELKEYGHIYMYRLRPTYAMRSRPISAYPGRSLQARAIMMMIQNNLDPSVAQFPHELITYGGNGSVFSNWAQYHLVMKYLSEMTDEQTLVLYSGHPLGLFPSHRDAPRVVIANGMMVPNYSTKDLYEKQYAMMNTIYGQMTAGSWVYIGPQGIVHGTTLTIMNAGRKYLHLESLSGKVFVSSGLGGMSGAQPKAAVICGAIGVIAEVNPAALSKRHRQGWVQIVCDNLDDLLANIRRARAEKRSCSIGYLGNIVDVWERLAAEKEDLVDLGSDQTSLHNPYGGGYYPVGLTFEESNAMMVDDPPRFREFVQKSLVRHVNAINALAARGMRFWDYGNSFLLEASRAGANVFRSGHSGAFRYPSYVEDIMGDIFSLGFGPFRWICTSCDPSDLRCTDRIAAETIESLIQTSHSEHEAKQYRDNLLWIREAEKNQLVVGSQSRILYANAEGRARIALAFGEAIRRGELKAPVVLSRDHHDTGGADSPWRETSNIDDGSRFTADMSFQTVVGDAFRGATWVSYHNGGGTGWGEAMNGGFGLVVDGSMESDRRAKSMLWWDANNGIARRAWGRHPLAEEAIRHNMEIDPLLRVTVPHHCDESVLDRVCPP